MSKIRVGQVYRNSENLYDFVRVVIAVDSEAELVSYLIIGKHTHLLSFVRIQELTFTKFLVDVVEIPIY